MLVCVGEEFPGNGELTLIPRMGPKYYTECEYPEKMVENDIFDLSWVPKEDGKQRMFVPQEVVARGMKADCDPLAYVATWFDSGYQDYRPILPDITVPVLYFAPYPGTEYDYASNLYYKEHLGGVRWSLWNYVRLPIWRFMSTWRWPYNVFGISWREYEVVRRSDKMELRSQKMRELAPELDPLRLGTGWKQEDLEKPQVIIESTFGDSHPGSRHLNLLVEEVRKGIDEAGGFGARYFCTDICDGESQGTDGMNYSLVSREMIANMIEIHARATTFDAGGDLASCDKGMPANLIGLVPFWERLPQCRSWRKRWGWRYREVR